MKNVESIRNDSMTDQFNGRITKPLVKFFLRCHAWQIDYTQPISRDVQQDTVADKGDSQIGTVGCVAVDAHGNLAAATSTGGLVNKMVGRIGDTPIIGAGTYANSFCAVSATGKGEAIIRATIARDVSALMEYKGLSLKEAAAYVIEQCVPKGNAGLVAVSATGEVTMPFNTTGMFRACATEDGYSEFGIWPLDSEEWFFQALGLKRITGESE